MKIRENFTGSARFKILACAILIILMSIVFVSCQRKSPAGPAPANTPTCTATTATPTVTQTATLTLTRTNSPTMTVTETMTATIALAGKFVFSANGDIYSENADGSNQVNLTNSPNSDGSPAWSPDGTKIAYVSDSTDGSNTFSDIWVMDADGQNKTRLTYTTGNSGQGDSSVNPAWSPDGSKIAYNTGYNNTCCKAKIGIMDPNGSNKTFITGETEGNYEPAWSPDGAKIAFVSVIDPVNHYEDIYVMNPDGSARTRLTFSNFYAYSPAWSPDGSRIAFTYESLAVVFPSLFVMDKDGGNQVNLSHIQTWDAWSEITPCWSPDGTEIAFIRYTNFNSYIYVMYPYWSPKIKLAMSGMTYMFHPSWHQ